MIKQANLEKIHAKPSEKARDLQNYEIAVESDEITAKASFDDMTVDANLERLLEFLRRRARAIPLDS